MAPCIILCPELPIHWQEWGGADAPPRHPCRLLVSQLTPAWNIQGDRKPATLLYLISSSATFADASRSLHRADKSPAMQ